MRWDGWSLVGAWVLAIGVTGASAQSTPARPDAPAGPPAVAAPVADPLGRDTPRGSVRGFLSAARKGESDVARQYLDTQINDAAGQELARQLFVILDAKLPARLPQISDEPLGSRANPLTPTSK